MKKINTQQREINKPSELTQSVFFKNDDCNAITSLTATQMDMFNLVFYKSREYFIKEKIELTEFVPFEIDLKTFATEFNKYQSSEYRTLIKQLVDLADVKVIINALNKNKEMDVTFTRFIHKLTVSKHKNNNRKKVRLVLDGDICKMIYDVKKLFTKFYLKIQFSMKSKYSKLLYEILRDYLGKNYNGCKAKTIEYELLLAVLNVDFENTNNGQWALFNQNILKKAVNEINEKSDIQVDYEAIKERPKEGGRLQVTKIKFMMGKQPDSRLQQLELLDLEPELPIEEQIIYNKKKSIAMKRLEQSKKYTTINNEEAWIKKTIETITDEFIILQDEIETSKEALDEADLTKYGIHLMDRYGTFDYKEYKLIDSEGATITKNAFETYKILNEIKEEFNL